MNKTTDILAVIPARAGSIGVRGKNIRLLLGKEVIRYTIEDATESRHINRIVVTSDDPVALAIAGDYSRVETIQRPAHLSDNTVRIDHVIIHAVQTLQEQKHFIPEIIVLLYANVPVRADGIIDKVVEYIQQTGADSVQTVCNPGKFHPYWLYQLTSSGQIAKYIDNQIYRRQELPPLYAIDGAVLAFRYASLLAGIAGNDPHAFLGHDRRAIIQESHETVDIDNERDLYLAEAILRMQQTSGVIKT